MYANEASQMWDFAKFLEVTIDRPAKDVWPYLFGKKCAAWTKTEYTPIAGEPGKLGEIYEMAYPLANQGGHIRFETIKVDPERHLVLKITYKKNDKSERRLVGYDFNTLREVNGRTTLFFQQASELPVDPTEDLNSLTEKHDKFLAEIFQDLKRVVEGYPLGDSKNPWSS
jgi:uncharacterized protein YndB with AHSA1/START domain